MQQFGLGSCQADQIAARVLTRVLGRFPGKRNQIIIDAGFLALSEQGFQHLGGSYAKIKVILPTYLLPIITLKFLKNRVLSVFFAI